MLVPADLEKSMFVEVRVENLDVWVPCQVVEIDEDRVTFLLIEEENAYELRGTIVRDEIWNPAGKVLRVRPIALTDERKNKILKMTGKNITS